MATPGDPAQLQGESDQHSQLRRLLVATDLSDNALIALQAGVLLAAQLPASLDVLHCVPRHFGADVSLFWDESAAPPGAEEQVELRHRVAAQLSRVAPAFSPDALLVRSGKPHARITEAAEELDIDLVLLGGHTPRRMLDGLLGTTAERVLRTCQRPVLFVNRSMPEVPRRILAVTDFSKPADYALRKAVSWARQWAPREDAVNLVAIQLLHVAAFTHPLYRPLDVSSPLQERALSAALLGGGLVQVQPRVYSAPTAAEGILEAAQEMDADLIVIGTHGLGFVMRALVGGVTAEVIRTLRRPILAVPPPPSEQEE